MRRRLPASERAMERVAARAARVHERGPPARSTARLLPPRRQIDRLLPPARPPPPPQSIISLYHKINCVAQNNAEYSVARAKDAFTTNVRTNVLCSVKAGCDPGVCVLDTCVCTTIKFSRYVLYQWLVCCNEKQLDLISNRIMDDRLLRGFNF